VAPRISKEAVKLLHESLELVARDILQASYDQRENGVKTLQPQHIQDGIDNDPDLKKLFPGVIPGTTVTKSIADSGKKRFEDLKENAKTRKRKSVSKKPKNKKTSDESEKTNKKKKKTSDSGEKRRKTSDEDRSSKKKKKKSKDKTSRD